MPAAIYNIYKAKSSFSSLVERASQGEEILIAKAGKPIAKLVPFKKRTRRKPGGWEGIYISSDFDEPLPPDLQAAFEGR